DADPHPLPITARPRLAPTSLHPPGLPPPSLWRRPPPRPSSLPLPLKVSGSNLGSLALPPPFPRLKPFSLLPCSSAFRSPPSSPGKTDTAVGELRRDHILRRGFGFGCCCCCCCCRGGGCRGGCCCCFLLVWERGDDGVLTGGVAKKGLSSWVLDGRCRSCCCCCCCC
ncbi:unnamed protein product, partial [Ectocarpus sp. 8 AP-2014]